MEVEYVARSLKTIVASKNGRFKTILFERLAGTLFRALTVYDNFELNIFAQNILEYVKQFQITHKWFWNLVSKPWTLFIAKKRSNLWLDRYSE